MAAGIYLRELPDRDFGISRGRVRSAGAAGAGEIKVVGDPPTGRGARLISFDSVLNDIRRAGEHAAVRLEDRSCTPTPLT